MPGELDLDEMLSNLSVTRRPSVYTVIDLGDQRQPVLSEGVEALIVEAEGVTAVVTEATARQLGAAIDFRAAWLTLDVHSALEAVGLTAAVSQVLADNDIACNILAGFHHDHLLVPINQAEQAIDALQTLRSGH